jgi:hypothetical protein
MTAAGSAEKPIEMMKLTKGQIEVMMLLQELAD